MKLTLYYAPVACPLVPLISLYEAGADFEIKPVSLRSKQQLTPEYLKLNPKHKVPVLVIDGEPLTENVAILTWIARAYPDAYLLPTEPKHAIRALSLMAWCSSGLHPILHRINSPAYYCDLPGAKENVHKLAMKNLDESFRIVDGMLAGRQWVFDEWTAVDAYLFWVWRRASLFGIVDLSPYKHYAAHAERMGSRASVKRALAFEKEVQAAESPQRTA